MSKISRYGTLAAGTWGLALPNATPFAVSTPRFFGVRVEFER
jgi:hypothetical protein